jgi:hypothetical protein
MTQVLRVREGEGLGAVSLVLDYEHEAHAHDCLWSAKYDAYAKMERIRYAAIQIIRRVLKIRR